MDQIKIGKFIAEQRKQKSYTQRELAEALGISDKTISKWERGNGFPEVSLLLSLCKERFVPDMKAYIMGPHTITKRKLKCPCCSKIKYCRHVLTK